MFRTGMLLCLGDLYELLEVVLAPEFVALESFFDQALVHLSPRFEDISPVPGEIIAFSLSRVEQFKCVRCIAVDDEHDVLVGILVMMVHRSCDELLLWFVAQPREPQGNSKPAACAIQADGSGFDE
jgi:hypothetical protein